MHMGSLLGAKAAPSLVPFDWEGIPRPSMTRSFEELVVCEIDLRVWAGSYAGLVDRIQEIAGMGFNGIVLTGPSTLSSECSPLARSPLSF